MNNNRCVKCNEIIPEGRQVCPNCEGTGYKRLTERYIDEQGKNCVRKLAWDGEILHTLVELEDKIENGTLIELPKKCYWVVDILGWVIIEYDIQKISYSFENNKINYMHCKECNSRSYKYFDSKDLDDDVFLTKAEAEKKLKEIQNKR